MNVLAAYPWIADRFQLAREGDTSAYVRAFCPLSCHRSGPTLKLWLGADGRLMFGCYAGCTGDGGAGKLEVLRAVGATWKDCYPQDTDWKRVKQEVVARYRYRDEAGAVLYECVRLEPGRGGRDKEFRQRRPVPGGGWAWDMTGVRRVLYQLPELLDPANARRTVLVVAGEKDCDTLKAVGVLATTNVGGERADWLDDYSRVLAGRDVVVVEDRDGAGRRHAHEVVGSLLAHDVGSVRRCVMPDAKDTTAFLNRLRTNGVTDHRQLRQALSVTVGAARQWRTATH